MLELSKRKIVYNALLCVFKLRESCHRRIAAKRSQGNDPNDGRASIKCDEWVEVYKN